MAQDDAGAQEAYERELDEEEDIRRMDAEAAVRRAQGATQASAAAGSSSSATPAQSSAGEPHSTRACALHSSPHTHTVQLNARGAVAGWELMRASVAQNCMAGSRRGSCCPLQYK